ncbi:hypothetical protein CRI94_12010 [Longibacter salinarum]|uniref:Uncharacterized protein n=2 Tax=Longibacter salinarum TaxID=1850348 RepID=A0A2A8CVK8_9BACT|nr:hypothetical protein CRI94_12010 [Longibacter salinarum]
MRNAVDHLLSREPLQGAEALDRIMRDIRSDYFPGEQESAVRRLKATPIRHARKSLISSVVDITLKDALLDLNRYDQSQEILNRCVVLKALPEVADSHPVRDIIVSKSTKVLDRMDDVQLGRFVFMCGGIDYIFPSIGNKQQRITDYLQNIDVTPSGKDETVWRPLSLVHPDLLFALKVRQLRDLAMQRIKGEGPKAIAEAAPYLPENMEWEGFHSLAETVVDDFVNASSYFETERYGKVVVQFIEHFDEVQMRRLLSSLRTNDQVYGAKLGEEPCNAILNRAVQMCETLEDELQDLYKFCRDEQDKYQALRERADFIEGHCAGIN